MARTVDRCEVIVQGGSHDGLRLQALIKDDGTWEFTNAAVFFPDGLGDYVLDGEERRLIHRSTL